MIKLSSWGLTNRYTAKLSKQNNLSKTRSLMVQPLLIIKGLGTSKDPLDATLMGSHEIHGPKAKDGGAAPGQVLDVNLSPQLPLAQEEF